MNFENFDPRTISLLTGSSESDDQQDDVSMGGSESDQEGSDVEDEDEEEEAAQSSSLAYTSLLKSLGDSSAPKAKRRKNRP